RLDSRWWRRDAAAVGPAPAPPAAPASRLVDVHDARSVRGHRRRHMPEWRLAAGRHHDASADDPAADNATALDAPALEWWVLDARSVHVAWRRHVHERRLGARHPVPDARPVRLDWRGHLLEWRLGAAQRRQRRRLDAPDADTAAGWLRHARPVRLDWRRHLRRRRLATAVA